jgi:hypothetical protein
MVKRYIVVGVVTGALLALGAPPVAAATPSGSASATWQTNGPVYAVAYAGGRVYLGGAFTAVRPPGSSTSTSRNHVAAFSASTGALLSWNPNADGTVRAIAVGPAGTVYLGGQFSHVRATQRLKLAAVTPDTGALTSWAPKANALVRALGVTSDGATVYAGGDFTTVGGLTRLHAVAISTSSGGVRSWKADATSSGGTFANVAALSIAGSRVYLGGTFTAVNGVARVNSAAVSASSGSVQSWRVKTPSTVLAIAHDSGRVYIGGRGSGGYLRAFDVSTAAQRWDAPADGDVQALYLRGSQLYVGGHFNTLRSVTRHHLAALDAGTGGVLGWNPGVNGSVGILAIGGDSSHVGVGGDFTFIGGRSQQDFAQFAG